MPRPNSPSNLMPILFSQRSVPPPQPNQPLAIGSSSPLTTAFVNVPYSTAITATGGTPPYAWNLGGPPPPPQSIKWNPGHWMLSFAQPVGAGETIATRSDIQSEITACLAASPTVIGYKPFVTWAYLEATQGNYSAAISDITTLCSRTKVTLQINLGVFNHGPEIATGAGTIPAYILETATYGNALMGSSGFTPQSPYLYGYWVSDNGAYNANFVNANVNARVVALANGLSPLDANPNLEEIIICAYDDMLPNPGAGINDAAYFAALQTIMLAFKTAFPTTNISIQQAYGYTAGPTQNFAQWCVQHEILCGASDVMGASAWSPNAPVGRYTQTGGVWASAPTGTSGTLASNWILNTGTYQLKFGSGTTVTAAFTQGSNIVNWAPSVSAQDPSQGVFNFAPLNLQWGIMAYLGIPIPGDGWVPPTPLLNTYASTTLDVQAGDMINDATPGVWYQNFTPIDIIPMANNFLNCSKLFWSYLTPSQTSVTAAQWINVLPVLQANALTNIAYPSSYP